jgi:CheY-like chemotaxis protein
VSGDSGLLDARMPDTDGPELAAKIRKQAELAATPIILRTSGTSQETCSTAPAGPDGGASSGQECHPKAPSLQEDLQLAHERLYGDESHARRKAR